MLLVDRGQLTLESLRFRYALSGDQPSWRPLRAFDDVNKVYIQFPAGIAQGELPPLFVIGPQGDGQLVNYRFRSPYYIVDQLFGAAEATSVGNRVGGSSMDQGLGALDSLALLQGPPPGESDPVARQNRQEQKEAFMARDRGFRKGKEKRAGHSQVTASGSSIDRP